MELALKMVTAATELEQQQKQAIDGILQTHITGAVGAWIVLMVTKYCALIFADNVLTWSGMVALEWALGGMPTIAFSFASYWLASRHAVALPASIVAMLGLAYIVDYDRIWICGAWLLCIILFLYVLLWNSMDTSTRLLANATLSQRVMARYVGALVVAGLASDVPL